MTFNRVSLITAGFALAATLTFGGIQAAFAASPNTDDSFRLQGTIVSVDSDARTLVVRTAENKDFTVYVPENARINLSRAGNFIDAPSNIAIDNAHRGLKVNMRVAKTDDSSPLAMVQ